MTENHTRRLMFLHPPIQTLLPCSRTPASVHKKHITTKVWT